MTGHANRTLADRAASKTDKEQAILALMALNWKPSVLKAIGSRPMNLLLRRLRDNVLPADEYRIFADMIVRATDEAMPILHSRWALWQGVITRFHLYEIAGVKCWISLIARFDTRGIRSPICLRRIPFGGLIRPGWETPNPDMLLWLWQAAREDGSLARPTLPHMEHTPEPDFQNQILSLSPDGRYQANSDFNGL